MRILIAEDDPTNQKIARIWLTRGGHSITIVPDGQSCVERYRSEKFEVILMDITMPILGGVEATMEIRHYETENCFPRIPIIAITASAMVGDREYCLASGMDDYVAKPYWPQELDVILQKACSN
jgi:osomolarity two-component system sensor histidine kinase NIK1